jgi:pimeloyl-ACP methyl ester carboxylesterase
MRPLVLLPGFMCDADLWRDMVPDLEKLGPPQFGNVYSDDSLEGMARRVLDDAPKRFVLVGFSMGGFVARVLTLMAPERVIGVAFIASSARGYSPQEVAQRQAAAAGVQVTRTSTRGIARGLHPDRESDPELIGRLRDMQKRLGPEVHKRQASIVRLDGYADLEHIACPSLVVACRQDRLRSFDETKRMAERLPQARFEVLEECGHMAPLEKPHELATLLSDWISGASL